MSNNPQETTNDSIYRTPTDRLTCLTQPIALHAVAIGLSAHETNDYQNYNLNKKQLYIQALLSATIPNMNFASNSTGNAKKANKNTENFMLFSSKSYIDSYSFDA